MLKKLYRFLFVDDLLASLPSAAPAQRQPLKKKLMHRLSYLLLFSYTLLVLNPVMPIIADKIAHTFYQEYHRLTVHEVNGVYHVHLELSKAAKQCEKDKTAKTPSPDHSHIITVTTHNFSLLSFISWSYLPYKILHPTNYSAINYQPPRV